MRYIRSTFGSGGSFAIDCGPSPAAMDRTIIITRESFYFSILQSDGDRREKRGLVFFLISAQSMSEPRRTSSLVTMCNNTCLMFVKAVRTASRQKGGGTIPFILLKAAIDENFPVQLIWSYSRNVRVIVIANYCSWGKNEPLNSIIAVSASFLNHFERNHSKPGHIYIIPCFRKGLALSLRQSFRAEPANSVSYVGILNITFSYRSR